MDAPHITPEGEVGGKSIWIGVLRRADDGKYGLEAKNGSGTQFIDDLGLTVAPWLPTFEDLVDKEVEVTGEVGSDGVIHTSVIDEAGSRGEPSAPERDDNTIPPLLSEGGKGVWRGVLQKGEEDGKYFLFAEGASQEVDDLGLTVAPWLSTLDDFVGLPAEIWGEAGTDGIIHAHAIDQPGTWARQ